MNNTNNVSLQQIKELRKRTLIGVKDCKTALINANGDIEEAVNILKKKGRLKANPRLKRKSGNGAVFIYQDSDRLAMMLQTCETESVAMNEVFRSTGAKLVNMIAFSKTTVITEDMNDLLKDSIAVFKENMNIREVLYWNIEDDDCIGKYIHNDGQIAVVIKIKSKNNVFKENSVIKTLCTDLAMHICAAAPLFLDKESVAPEYLKKYEDIFIEQSQIMENVSDETRENIAKGKLHKHLSTVCLMDQLFIKDNKHSIKQLIKDFEQQTGYNITVSDFVRMEV